LAPKSIRKSQKLLHSRFSPLIGRGLEPTFTVLFSTIFHSIAQGNSHQRGKQWKVVEAKLLQTAASLKVQARRRQVLNLLEEMDGERNTP